MEFHSFILTSNALQQEVEHSGEEEREEKAKKECHTVSGEQSQVLQGNKPDVSQMFHDYLFAARQNPKKGSTQYHSDYGNPGQDA